MTIIFTWFIAFIAALYILFISCAYALRWIKNRFKNKRELSAAPRSTEDSLSWTLKYDRDGTGSSLLNYFKMEHQDIFIQTVQCGDCNWKGNRGQLIVDWNERDEPIYRCPECNKLNISYDVPVEVCKSKSS